ncbi:L-type lectin-domain containing receptor kinase VII.1-like isoform X2 [Carya illinoinensis]|uniref:L-type lectin-domain containing receptor kinase VII.1-like isoform X2 n=1 Tax=Carya illinoinensis TaxID=32201 RepID=UPI001C728CD6|nr:L-type lectin-domain containing receptor kinase VII.1-like isoform X2 [Carya illinoinensis]
MNKHNHMQSVLMFLLLPIFLFFRSISAVDFTFNGFSSSDMLLYGFATVESRVLTLTNRTTFTMGRALYPQKIPAKKPNSSYVYPFSTSFIFSMAPYKNTLPGHGIIFLFVPFTGITGASSTEYLGLLNFSNNGNPEDHIFGVEFDVIMNEEFDDINGNHVGIDVNSLKSIKAHDAGYWPDNQRGNNVSDIDDANSFKELKMNNGMKRPLRPLLNVPLNLSKVFEDEMYVGFTSSTGMLMESHKILAWSFSNSNFSLSEELITTGLPSFVLPKGKIFRSKGFIAGMTVGGFIVILLCDLFVVSYIKRQRRKARERAEMEEWELEYWPHRIAYQEIEAATEGFAEENVIRTGGNGNVYKGVLVGGAKIAVKCISHENDGMREFLAEISSLGRLKHRSLVGLRGWCKREKGSFLLIYDYMENGSLDKWVFECCENKMLSCEDRIRILKDVASAVLYLHEGWESKVLHRDIKASNVLLDKDMNGRLGDFGLARMHGHGQEATITRVAGTVGYLAPELIRSGRASAQTDVFGFGALILEVMCGRRPIEEGKPPLVDWAWQLMVQGQLFNALDERLRAIGGFDEQKVDRVLHLGLLCVYPDPSSRPTMRQVVKVLEGNNEVDELGSEDMDAYLIQRLKSGSSEFSMHFGSSSHPTFEDI